MISITLSLDMHEIEPRGGFSSRYKKVVMVIVMVIKLVPRLHSSGVGEERAKPPGVYYVNAENRPRPGATLGYPYSPSLTSNSYSALGSSEPIATDILLSTR